MNSLTETVKILKALADKNRIRICIMLQEKELCVCQLNQILKNIAISTLSNHIKILHNAGIIKQRKSGKYIFYKLTDNPEIHKIINIITRPTLQDNIIKNDFKILKTIKHP